VRGPRVEGVGGSRDGFPRATEPEAEEAATG
jgi:hypothetical protein